MQNKYSRYIIHKFLSRLRYLVKINIICKECPYNVFIFDIISHMKQR